VAGLQDRSSKPRSSPSQAAPALCAAVEALRRQRHTGAQIAAEVGVSAATVSRILKRRGLNRLSALEPAEPVRRYERAAPGEIIHIDIKKLGKFSRTGHRITSDQTGQSHTRGVGWEYVHLGSTTLPVSPIPKSCRTKNVGLACAFSSTPCASFETSASKSSAS
jgi:Homeodomain-like domain